MKGYIKIASSLYSRSALYTKSDVIVYLIRPLYKFEFDNNDAIKSNNWRYHLMLTMFKLDDIKPNHCITIFEQV